MALKKGDSSARLPLGGSGYPENSLKLFMALLNSMSACPKNYRDFANRWANSESFNSAPRQTR